MGSMSFWLTSFFDWTSYHIPVHFRDAPAAVAPPVDSQELHAVGVSSPMCGATSRAVPNRFESGPTIVGSFFLFAFRGFIPCPKDPAVDGIVPA